MGWRSLFGRVLGKVVKNAGVNPPGPQCGTNSAATGDSAPHVQQLSSWLMDDHPGSKPQEGSPEGWAVGEVVAQQFEVLEEIRGGAMGVVYKVLDRSTHRLAVAKVPKKADPATRRMFRREAEAWFQLHHPHIVRAFAFKGKEGNNAALAVFADYCAGGSLKDLLARTRSVPLDQVLDIAIQVCWAMEYAHSVSLGPGQTGLLHRDLKPGNIVLDADGRALVTDFGLVKACSSEALGLDKDALSPVEAALIETVSCACGTPAYMPPEQWTGRACKASDIYSFGVTLYEMCCGRLPFIHTNAQALMNMHCHAPFPDPRQWRSDSPDALNRLIKRCTSKRADERPQSFGPLAEELKRIYRGLTGRKCPRRKPTQTEIEFVEFLHRILALLETAYSSMMDDDLPEARRQYTEAVRQLEQRNSPFGLGEAYGNLAEIARREGNIREQEEFLTKALEAFRCYGNNPWGSEGVRKSLCLLAQLAATKGDHKKAEELFLDALAASVGDQQKSDCLTSMGAWARENKDYVRARRWCREALLIKEAHKDTSGMFSCQIQLAIISAAFDTDRECTRLQFQKALEAAKVTGEPRDLADVYFNQAAWIWTRDLEEAKRLFNKAGKIFLALNDSEGLRRVEANMARLMKTSRGDK